MPQKKENICENFSIFCWGIWSLFERSRVVMFYRLFQLIYLMVVVVVFVLSKSVLSKSLSHISPLPLTVQPRECVLQKCVYECFCVSALLNLCPFRLLLAADSTLGLAVCQVSFMLPVSADDALVPQVFNVTVSFPALWQHTDEDRHPVNFTTWLSRCGMTVCKCLFLLSHFQYTG